MTSTDPATPTGATVRVAAASARTDVIRTGLPSQPRQDVATPIAPWLVRTVGAALAVSSGAWALSFVLGIDAGAVLGTVVAVAFQGSMLALLALVRRTRATGTRTAGRVLVGIQAGVLVLATLQSASEAIPGADAVAVALDPFWPLSMLGMLVVGLTVARVGRWRGVARAWIVVATSWIALLPVMMIAPQEWSAIVATGHVLLGYVVLGAVLAVAPGLTRR